MIGLTQDGAAPFLPRSQSELHRRLQSEHDNVGVLAGAPRVKDVLKVGPKREPVPYVERVVELEGIFVALHRHWPQSVRVLKPLALCHIVVDVRATDRKADVVLGARVEWSVVEQADDNELIDGGGVTVCLHKVGEERQSPGGVALGRVDLLLSHGIPPGFTAFHQWWHPWA